MNCCYTKKETVTCLCVYIKLVCTLYRNNKLFQVVLWNKNLHREIILCKHNLTTAADSCDNNSKCKYLHLLL